MTSQSSSNPRSFRATLLTLIIFAVCAPMALLLVHQIYHDHQTRSERLQLELDQTTQHSSWLMAQMLNEIGRDMDLLASDLLPHSTANEASLINHERLQHLLQRHSALGAALLLDDRLVIKDAVPSSALHLPLQYYESQIKTVIYQQVSGWDSRTRIHLLQPPHGAPQIFYLRPILQSPQSLGHPQQVQGLLLAQIDADELATAIKDKLVRSQALPASLSLDTLGVQLESRGHNLFSNTPHHAASLSSSRQLPLGNNIDAPLHLTMVSLNSVSWLQILKRHGSLLGFALIALLFIIWLTKRLTDRLVAPLTHLNAITTRLEASDFSERIIDSGLISKMRYGEFTELFRLLDTMESTITRQFSELHASHTTLEERVMERTNELIENVSLLDEQRRVLQQLIRYSMELQQVESIDEAGQLTLAMVERTTRCSAGLHLIRKDYVSEFIQLEHLSPATGQALAKHLPEILSRETLTDIAKIFPTLHLLPIGNDQLDYFGFIAIELSEQTPLASDALIMLDTLITSAIRQYNSTKHLHWLAHIDSVTQIANRHYFSERYEEKKREFNRALPDSHFALFTIDANSLKKINDHHGHRYGDKMLKTIAHHLKLSVRSQDTLARVGGDEFCLILDRADTDTCRTFSERLSRLRNDLQMEIKGEIQPISFSFGYACTEEDSLKNLMILADERMYQDKKRHYSTQAQPLLQP